VTVKLPQAKVFGAPQRKAIPMHIEPVEIYSDASNAAVMRHPGRRFPGVLLQGDTLSILVRQAASVAEQAETL
jgi:hypothetical protein